MARRNLEHLAEYREIGHGIAMDGMRVPCRMSCDEVPQGADLSPSRELGGDEGAAHEDTMQFVQGILINDHCLQHTVKHEDKPTRLLAEAEGEFSTRFGAGLHEEGKSANAGPEQLQGGPPASGVIRLDGGVVPAG